MKQIIAFAAGISMLLSANIAFAAVDLTLNGGTVTVQQGQSYNEPGYSANSTVDGDITNLVNVSGINSNVGTHTITYSVTDSALESATAFRTLIIQSTGNLMPYCSGPFAPGWRAGVVGGGCGGKEVVVAAGTAGCPFFMGPAGCILKR